MSIRFAPLLVALAVLTGTSLAGCLQGRGEPCQVDDDCEGNLTCCGGSARRRGVCQEPSETCIVEAEDAGAGTDAGRVDAGAVDAGGELDAGPSDAGESDAGPSDAGPSDAGPSDAGPSDAGSEDAGPSDAGASDAGDAGT